MSTLGDAWNSFSQSPLGLANPTTQFVNNITGAQNSPANLYSNYITRGPLGHLLGINPQDNSVPDYGAAMGQAPAYIPGYDPKSMSMTDALQGYQNQNHKGYDAFAEQAMRKGPSDWLNMSLNKNALEGQTQREQAGRQINASTQGQMDQLASRGGLSSGARERATQGGANNLLNMTQDIRRQGNLNNLGLNIQDQSNRLNMLGQVPGMEQGRINAWGTAKQNDIANQLGETGRQNDYNMGIWNSNNQVRAAQMQAQATANSGSKGMFSGIFG